MPSPNPDLTTKMRLPSPTPPDPPDVPGDIKALANAIESALFNRLFKTGSFVMNAKTGSVDADADVTFGGVAFPGRPFVVLTAHSRWWTLGAWTVTPTGFHAGARHTLSSGPGSDYTFTVTYVATWLGTDAAADQGSPQADAVDQAETAYADIVVQVGTP